VGKLLVAQLGLRGVKTQLMQLAPCIRLQEQAGLEGGEGGKEELKARVLSRHRWPALLPLTPSPPLMPLVRCACSSVITMMRQHVRVRARRCEREGWLSHVFCISVTSPTPSPLFASYSSSSSASMTSPLRQCGVLEELRVGEKGKDGVSGGCASSGAQVTRTPLTMLLETLDNCRAASDSCVPDNIHTKGATKGRVDRHVVSRARAHMNNVASDDDKENVRGGVTGEGLPEGMDVTSVRTGVRQVPGRLCTVRETTIKTGVCGNSNSNVKVLRLSDTREPGREGEKWARDAGGGGGGGGKERHGIGGGASGVVHVGTQRQNAETVGLARHAAWRGLVGRGFDAESASVKGTTIHESLRAAEDALLMLLTSP